MTRHVHLGLGNFFRAHQAWYTQHAPDGDEWRITAFSNSSTRVVDALTGQGGRYRLITRGRDGDHTETITSLAQAVAGTDRPALVRALADARLSVVTLTVTEAGYATTGPDSTATRLVAGLAARRAADSGPLAVVPCDNLPDNGRVVRDAVLAAAPADLAAWIGETVSFVSTVVDRITPRTTDADIAPDDAVPVVTEPFSEWILAGEFPAGRPRWDATVTGDITPFEHRKLRLLNGAHSLLAYAGLARGHDTVAGAIDDPTCRAWVQQWWDEASSTVALPAADLDGYRAALLDRFANPRIRHELRQIAADGSQKLPVRVAPVLRATGPHPAGALVVAAWIAHLRDGTDVRDVAADRAVAAAHAGVPQTLALLDPALADDADLRSEVERQLSEVRR